MTREELNEEIQKEIEMEQKKEKIKKIIKLSIKCILALLIITTIFYSYTTYISTVKINVREYRIINKKVPTPFNGIKIIQLSDLHYGSTMLQENVIEIRKMTNQRKPDIIVFTGDLIAKNYNLNSKEQESLIKELKKMNATLGKYAILGDEDTEKISTIFNQSDFTILRNDFDLIYKDNSTPILLIGLSSKKKGQDISKAYAYFQQETHNSNIYTITLLHEPDSVDDILSNNQSDLFLAGHSHNGEIRLPFTHTALKKKEGAMKYDQDYYKINKSKLYISSGLGTESGIRLFCRPSINFFRISNK
jgi:predicted MPP superfamily phosphohydrolase